MLVVLVPAADDRVIPEPAGAVIVLPLMTIPELVPETEIALESVLLMMLTLVGGVAVAPLTLMPCPTVVYCAVFPVAVTVLG